MTDDSHPDDASRPDDDHEPGQGWRRDGAEPRVPDAVTDGGTDTAAADAVAIDPWGSSTVADYRDLFEEFGIEAFEDVLPEVADSHYLMRRGVIFGHRDYRAVAAAMQAEEPFAALSGFMPTGDPHIGHKLVFDEIIWHQRQGGDAYALIADLEAHAARELSWETIDEHTMNYVLSLLALGFDPDAGTLYRQSTNREVQDLAFELGAEANFSEMAAIYDFDGETDVSHMQSVLTQAADILYPQVDDEPKPTVIPVGPDQDPHMRLTRDLAARLRYFGVTRAYASFELDEPERELVSLVYDRLVDREDADADTLRCEDAAALLREFDARDEGLAADAVRASVLEKLDNAGQEPIRPRTRILDRKATESAFEALIEAIEGEKRVYEEHVDAFELDRADAESIAREIEVAHGGYGFVPPSSIYHRFMTGLTGGKMSSSVPASHISLLDDPAEGYEKVRAATTGGRETAELQRELGGEADECPVYELYAYLLAGDDDEFATEVYEECVGGERLCGDCKEQAATLMEAFLEEHQDEREAWAERLDELDVELDSPRKRG